MKIKVKKLVSIIVASMALFHVSASKSISQINAGDDIIIIRGGYAASEASDLYGEKYTYEPEEVHTVRFQGYGLSAEYNFNYMPFIMGLGIEYQRMRGDIDNQELDGLIAQFVMAQISFKYLTDSFSCVTGGDRLYLGASIAGKYNFANGNKFRKEVDAWVYAVIGFLFPITDRIFIDLQGRLGINTTNRQWGKRTKGGSAEPNPEVSFDWLAPYLGVGIKL